MKKTFIYFCLTILALEVLGLSIKNAQIIRTLRNLENYLSDNEPAINNINMFLELQEISEWRTRKNISIREYSEDKEAIVFFLSATCPLCDRDAAYWNALFYKYQEEMKIFGLTFDEQEAIDNYVLRNRIEFPIFKINKVGDGLKEILLRAPLTMVLYKDGTIKKLYEGTIDEEQVDEIIKQISFCNESRENYPGRLSMTYILPERHKRRTE